MHEKEETLSSAAAVHGVIENPASVKPASTSSRSASPAPSQDFNRLRRDETGKPTAAVANKTFSFCDSR